MKKFTVKQTKSTEFFDAENAFAIFDVRGNQVGREFSEEWEAKLAGCHWALAGPLFSRLGFKSVNTGSNHRAWTASPFYGITAFITKHPQFDWSVAVTVDGNVADARADTFKTREAAAKFVNQFGDGNVTLTDAMSREEFVQDRRTAGKPGICRSMESYYTM